MFSLHSGRSSGNTWMRNTKLGQVNRVVICWASGLNKDSEAMYNAMGDQECLEVFVHTARST